MKRRDNINQVNEIAHSAARLVEGIVVKTFPQTRTAQVRLDGSGQYINVALGHIDPSLVHNEGSRILLYRTSGAIYALSAMPGQYMQSSPGVVLGDRWGSTEFTIFNSSTYNPYTYASTYAVAGIDSMGNVRYCGDMMPVRKNEAHTGCVFIPLPIPYTHDSFNGDSFSDVGTFTKIENTSWSTVIPSDARALLIRLLCRDSGSAATSGLYVILSGDGTNGAFAVRPSGKANDDYADGTADVPCTNGDIWYRVEASGTNTMDIWLYCFGYWI